MRPCGLRDDQGIVSPGALSVRTGAVGTRTQQILREVRPKPLAVNVAVTPRRCFFLESDQRDKSPGLVEGGCRGPEFFPTGVFSRVLEMICNGCEVEVCPIPSV